MDRAKLALYGADAIRWNCDLCKSVKRRRRAAKKGSHPHSEDKIRRTNGAHTCGFVAVYWDVQDYVPEPEFLHGARYDLLGYCVITAGISCIPMQSKDTSAITAR